eukprot:1128706-Pleurochrysis_carterae.AAC.1
MHRGHNVGSQGGCLVQLQGGEVHVLWPLGSNIVPCQQAEGLGMLLQMKELKIEFPLVGWPRQVLAVQAADWQRLWWELAVSEAYRPCPCWLMVATVLRRFRRRCTGGVKRKRNIL